MTWDGRQSVSTVYLFFLADVCLRSLLSGLTSIYKELFPLNLSPCLFTVVSCLETFLFASITQDIFGRILCFKS